MDVAYNFTQKQKLDFTEIFAETGFIWPVMKSIYNTISCIKFLKRVFIGIFHVRGP